MGARWTEAEDRALAERMAEHGERWDGWRELLPGRGIGAIRARMDELRRRATWTDAQRRTLLAHAAAMARACGHTVADCAAELQRLRSRHARGK